MQKLLLVAGLLMQILTHAQDTARANASISQATVYFGYGAELTQQSKLRVSPATRIVVIDQLSTNVDINSLQISCPEQMAILSHRYQLYQPPVPTVAKTKEIEHLEDSIKLIQKDISRVENQVSIEQEILTKTGLLIETTVAQDGSKTVSSIELLKLVDYYNARIEKSKTTIYNHRQAILALNLRITQLNERIASLQTAAPKIPRAYGQLILQVICKNAGELPVSLSYYTSHAGWTPVYDVRVNSKTNKVKLVYKAMITQTTGIDWTKTKLNLSTGTPNFGVTAPVLSPWYLQLYVPEIYRALQGRVAGLNVTRNAMQSFKDNAVLSEVMVADSNGDLRKEDKSSIDPSTLQQYTTLNEGQLNTNFEIDLPYDIQTDGQLHSVTIKDEEISCILKNYAVPRVDKEAYLLAEIADWQNLDLLPGDANIIMDDTYIGQSLIDPNTTADTLNLSLGRDKRLAVKRSLVKELSSLKTSGGSNRQTFTYEIVLKNNKVTDVNLLLKDQFPLSSIKEVEVKLDDAGEAAINEETGVLTWKVSLKPGETRKFRFTYTVKYPKDKKIVNLK